jgi:hemolysin III
MPEIVVPDFGQYSTRNERLADLWVHVLGVCSGLAGGAALIAIAYLHGGLSRALIASPYVISLLAMLSVSAASNLAHVVHHHRRLQNADEAAIFLMIAGSYTPFTIQILHGALATVMTLSIWCLALAAAAGKLLLRHVSRRIWMLAYLLLGWAVIVAIAPLAAELRPAALILLVAGGIIYSLGTISYAMPQLRFRRAIWHGFVLVAAGLHFAAILIGVAMA